MAANHLDDTMNTCSIYFDENHDTSYTATATHSHWVHYTAKPGVPVNFAEFTEGNRVKAHLGGKDYFAALLNAFRQAEKSIYITGWQVNWDAQLAEGVRLVDALLASVQATPALRVYIMPWKNPAQVETYSLATERVFAALNTHVNRKAFHVLRAGELSGIFFSHHQKCVIVDERLAFVGGIDLAYGRYDDNYGLKADAAGRKGMNRYNPCVPAMVQAAGYNPAQEYAMLASHPEWRRDKPAFEQAKKREAASVARIIDAVLTRRESQSPGAEKSSFYLDAAIQPRMPWQDYQMEIEGPAVYDLVRNFVLRWNSYPPQSSPSALMTYNPSLKMPAAKPAKAGSCQVQVLRSASLKMCRKEHRAMPDVARQASGAQSDVLESMKLLIGKAEHYIYIENQFFVSAFGESSIKDIDALSPVAKSINPSLDTLATRFLPDKDAPENPLAEWLGDKIKRVIFANCPEPFHIYIVLPVYPEGRLDDPAIVAQIHLTRQSLVFGSHSLINRIRRSLWVKQRLEETQVPRKEWHRRIPELEVACGIFYEDIPLSACEEYVTLLNLRDQGELNGQPVTEQIYVHSKLMIVDDRWVLVGSANINDRSLLGTGDSELAVTIADTAHSMHDLDGTGTPAPCRTFARELRQNAWRKWMGSAAAECAGALDKPALKSSWEKIQTIAKNNTDLYDSVFEFIPRNTKRSKEISKEKSFSDDQRQDGKSKDAESASIWPILIANQKVFITNDKSMPFSNDFWIKYKGNFFEKKARLAGVEGCFTSFPTEWTNGENNLIPYNMRLIATIDNDEHKNLQTTTKDDNNNQQGNV